jgi:hypothetical protein
MSTIPDSIELFSELIVLSIGNSVTEVDQELGKATLGGCIVAKNVGKCSIPKWFWKTLPQSLSSTVVVAESITRSVMGRS